MDDLETQIAEWVRESVNAWSEGTERSQQAKDFVLGPSDMGYCSERVRRQLDRQIPEDPVDWNKAFIGTWLGEGLEQAAEQYAKSGIQADVLSEKVMTQVELWVTLEADTMVFKIPGHADLLDPGRRPILLDFKAKDGLHFVRKEPTPQGYQFQRHLYGLGAHQCGLIGSLDDLLVGNVYYDRSGRESLPYVQIEPFSHDVIHEATTWLEDVVYAYKHEEEARKEPPREVCETTCGFFTKCRGYDTDVEGRIDHPDHLSAVDLYLEGKDLEREGKRMKTAAQVRLKEIEGHTEVYTVRWTEISGGHVEYEREPYKRLDIRKKKGGAK